MAKKEYNVYEDEFTLWDSLKLIFFALILPFLIIMNIIKGK